MASMVAHMFIVWQSSPLSTTLSTSGASLNLHSVRHTVHILCLLGHRYLYVTSYADGISWLAMFLINIYSSFSHPLIYHAQAFNLVSLVYHQSSVASQAEVMSSFQAALILSYCPPTHTLIVLYSWPSLILEYNCQIIL